MKNILIIGASGQIGSELTPYLRNIYGADNVVASDFVFPLNEQLSQGGPSCKIDATQVQDIADAVRKYKIDTIFNLAAILSAKAEANPLLGWDIGVGALLNCLEVAREYKAAVFTPSSIGAFGPDTPRVQTPQDTIQRPRTIYGVTKVTGELLSDYYYKRFGVDTRSVRYPGIISNVTLPGGGTTDYAVEIYYAAIKEGKFTCPLKSGTFMDMMYMPDALEAVVQLMEADPTKLVHRNSFNIASMSFDPEMVCAEIKKHIPEFTMTYAIDTVRQEIADSWPDAMDDSCARKEWGWNPKYNLASMTEDMLKVLREKLK